MLNLLAVFLGGGTGSLLRYGVNILFEGKTHISLPMASLCVNVVGSFILGFLFILFLEKAHLSPVLKVALTVGFCGGLTTFSTFSLEAFHLFEGGQILMGLGYIFFSVIVCILMIALGMAVGTYLWR